MIRFSPGGKVTAAMSSQVSDGAAGLLIASEATVERHGFTPRARVHHISVLSADPVMMLTAPTPATQHALKRTGYMIEYPVARSFVDSRIQMVYGGTKS